MTKILQFTNPGEIDSRLITTMGVNLKENSNPIGQFGTGLKYAIAGILRLNGRMEIWSGQVKLIPIVKVERIRGREFGFIWLESHDKDEICLYPCGFTIELGKHWEPWMFYRELWANCHDEGGWVKLIDSMPEHGFANDETNIFVSCQELVEISQNLQDFFLLTDPLWSNAALQIHPGSAISIAYKGIRMVGKKEEQSEGFTYNLVGKHALTEDRTLLNVEEAKNTIAKAILQCNDKEIIGQILTGSENSFEAGLDFDWYLVKVSEEFVSVCLELIGKKGLKNLSARALVKRANASEYEKVVNSIPDTWEQMLEQAPKILPKPESNYSTFSYITDLEEALALALKGEKFWRDCASKLARQGTLNSD